MSIDNLYHVSLFTILVIEDCNNPHYKMIKEKDINTFDVIPSTLMVGYATEQMNWQGKTSLKFSFGGNFKDSFLHVAKQGQYPMTEDAWISLITTSKFWIQGIGHPSQRLLDLHKLLWEI